MTFVTVGDLWQWEETRSWGAPPGAAPPPGQRLVNGGAKPSERAVGELWQWAETRGQGARTREHLNAGELASS